LKLHKPNFGSLLLGKYSLLFVYVQIFQKFFSLLQKFNDFSQLKKSQNIRTLDFSLMELNKHSLLIKDLMRVGEAMDA